MANEFESKAEVHYRTVRSLYLVTYSQANLDTFSSRKSFAECVVATCFRKGKTQSLHSALGVWHRGTWWWWKPLPYGYKPEHAEAVGNCKEFHPNCKRSCHRVNIVFSELVSLGENMQWFIIDWTLKKLWKILTELWKILFFAWCIHG